MVKGQRSKVKRNGEGGGEGGRNSRRWVCAGLGCLAVSVFVSGFTVGFVLVLVLVLVRVGFGGGVVGFLAFAGVGDETVEFVEGGDDVAGGEDCVVGVLDFPGGMN